MKLPFFILYTNLHISNIINYLWATHQIDWTMDNILGYLVLALFIGFSVFSEIRKKANEKKSASAPVDTWAPTAPSVEVKTPKSPPQSQKKRDYYRPISDTNSSTSDNCQPQQGKNSMESQSDCTSSSATPFTISSAEEARRAIIWSEILRRKY